ncbi:MAG TPA: beta-ketoacyl synthase N-terminal-like domain-containing protein, partial [bacterium]|nr:beta-ketoacyl synthase N-terminal-like domain-containing protein [bacterium]
MRRVVVTGIGAMTPIGMTGAGLYDGIRRARSAIGRITRFDASSFHCQVAAEVSEFDPLAYMDAKRARRLDRFAQFSVAAARQAVDDARLHPEDEDHDQCGCFVGAALGGGAFAEEQHAIFLKEGIKKVRPTLALAVFSGSASCNIAIEFGLCGPSSANSDSCSSGAIAIGEAFRLIKSGGADLMLAGGVECPLSPLIFGAFDVIRAMSTRNDDPQRACRPFDKDRDGFVMGE